MTASDCAALLATLDAAIARLEQVSHGACTAIPQDKAMKAIRFCVHEWWPLALPEWKDCSPEDKRRIEEMSSAILDALVEPGLLRRLAVILEMAKDMQDDLSYLNQRNHDLLDKVDRLTEALHRIHQWSQRLTAFPKPDLKRADEILRAAGLSLDAISADNMRHAVDGVGRIAAEALELKE